MAIPVLDPISIEEDRSFKRRIKRHRKNGNPIVWGNASFEMRIASDSSGDYPIMTIPLTVTDNVMEFTVLKEDNKLKGGRRCYYNVVRNNEDGTSTTEFKGIINCQTAI